MRILNEVGVIQRTDIVRIDGVDTYEVTNTFRQKDTDGNDKAYVDYYSLIENKNNELDSYGNILEATRFIDKINNNDKMQIVRLG